MQEVEEHLAAPLERSLPGMCRVCTCVPSTDDFLIAGCRIRRSSSERKKRGRPRESQGSPDSASKAVAPGVDAEGDSKGLTSEPASDRGAMKHLHVVLTQHISSKRFYWSSTCILVNGCMCVDNRQDKVRIEESSFNLFYLIKKTE